MAKKNALKRTVRSELNSFKDVPLSAKEIMEIEEIQKEQYYNRKPLKELFCERNNRHMDEVNEYFKKHQRKPDGSVKATSLKVKDTKGSTPAPKEQVTEPSQTSYGRITPTGEIRIKYKSFRVEDGDIIFEV